MIIHFFKKDWWMLGWHMRMIQFISVLFVFHRWVLIWNSSSYVNMSKNYFLKKCCQSSIKSWWHISTSTQIIGMGQKKSYTIEISIKIDCILSSQKSCKNLIHWNDKMNNNKKKNHYRKSLKISSIFWWNHKILVWLLRTFIWFYCDINNGKWCQINFLQKKNQLKK